MDGAERDDRIQDLKKGSIKRGTRGDTIEYVEVKVREKSVTKIEVDCAYNCDNLRIVWKNIEC